MSHRRLHLKFKFKFNFNLNNLISQHVKKKLRYMQNQSSVMPQGFGDMVGDGSDLHIPKNITEMTKPFSGIVSYPYIILCHIMSYNDISYYDITFTIILLVCITHHDYLLLII